MRRLIARLSALPHGIRAAMLYAVAMGWAKALAMVTLPLITAMLSPAEFGRLELLSSAAEIGGLLCGAGLVDTLFRFGSATGAEGRAVSARLTGLALVIAALATAILLLLAPALARLMPLPTPRGDIMLLVIAVALEPVLGVSLGWLRMQRRAGAYMAFAMLRATLQYGLVALLVTTGHGTSGVLLAGCLTSLIVGSVLTRRQWQETGVRFAPQASVSLLRYGLPLVASGLANFVLGTADRWLLVGTVSAASLGHYALAVKIAMIVALLAQPFELWWFPQRLRFTSTPEGLARSSRVISLATAGMISSGALVAFAAPWLVRLLAPPSYVQAVPMVPFMVLAIVLQLLGNMANVGCYTRSTGALPMLVNGIAAAVALLLYLVLIPSFGVPGAIAATVVAQSVRFSVFAVLSQRTVPLTWPYGRLAALSVVAAGVAALPQFASPRVSVACLLGLGLISGAGIAGRWLRRPGRGLGLMGNRLEV